MCVRQRWGGCQGEASYCELRVQSEGYSMQSSTLHSSSSSSSSSSSAVGNSAHPGSLICATHTV